MITEKQVLREMSETNTEAEEKVVRTATGKVVSNKMDKSISYCFIERRVKHPVYGNMLLSLQNCMRMMKVMSVCLVIQ